MQALIVIMIPENDILGAIPRFFDAKGENNRKNVRNIETFFQNTPKTALKVTVLLRLVCYNVK